MGFELAVPGLWRIQSGVVVVGLPLTLSLMRVTVVAHGQHHPRVKPSRRISLLVYWLKLNRMSGLSRSDIRVRTSHFDLSSRDWQSGASNVEALGACVEWNKSKTPSRTLKQKFHQSAGESHLRSDETSSSTSCWCLASVPRQTHLLQKTRKAPSATQRPLIQTRPVQR